MGTVKLGERRVEGAGRREPALWRLAPLVFTACASAMILSLPLFPSLDGPVHLYYVDVLRGLLTHTGPYVQHYEINFYLTPYALEYYSLLVLEAVFPPFLSEKLLICGYVLTFILGFRYLVGAVTNAPSLWALAAAPFCLNCYIFLGFLNYSLGSALALFLCGYWLRWLKRLTARRTAVLVGEFVLIMLTHPVPAAVFLVFAGLHVAVSFVYEWLGSAGSWTVALRSHLRPVGILAAMGVSAAAWVKRFTSHPYPSNMIPEQLPESLLRRVGAELKFWTLAPLTGGVYRGVLIAVTASVAVALLIALSKRRECIGPAAISTAAIAAICLIGRLAAPEIVNGSEFFPERLSIYWVLFFIVVSAALKPPSWCAAAVGVVAVGATAVVLFFQWGYLSTAARDLTVALNSPPVKPASLGVILAEKIPSSRGDAVGDPFKWGSVHFFRKSKAILTNAPWMNLDIYMLHPKHVYPWTYCDPDRASRKMLATVTGTDAAAMDFAVRVDTEGPITRQVIERLGFRVLSRSPEMVFYSRP